MTAVQGIDGRDRWMDGRLARAASEIGNFEGDAKTRGETQLRFCRILQARNSAQEAASCICPEIGFHSAIYASYVQCTAAASHLELPFLSYSRDILRKSSDSRV